MHLYEAQVRTAAVAYRSVRIVNALCVCDFTTEIPESVCSTVAARETTAHITCNAISLSLCQHITTAQIPLNNAARHRQPWILQRHSTLNTSTPVMCSEKYQRCDVGLLCIYPCASNRHWQCWIRDDWGHRLVKLVFLFYASITFPMINMSKMAASLS